MNADAYLKRQGWRGSGHSLDHHGHGIKKPLLISHKRDQLGLGKKSAAHSVSDQWWMRAFDESLKNVGTGQESTLSQVRKTGINRGGLYGFFVRGEGLAGTLPNTEESSAPETSLPSTSTPPSRTTTPPTSETSEIMSETLTNPFGSTLKRNKRGRADEGPEKICKKQKESDETDEPRVEVAENPTNLKPKKKKHKRQAEGLEAFREKRKAFKRETNQLNSKLKKGTDRKTAFAEGRISDEAAQEAAVVARIDRMVANIIKRRQDAGEFKPPPRKASQKEDKKVKFARQKALRDAKKQLKVDLIQKALDHGELPQWVNCTGEEALERYQHNVRKTAKLQQQAKVRLAEIKREDRLYKKAQVKLEKKARRAEKLKQVKEMADKVKAGKKEQRGRPVPPAEMGGVILFDDSTQKRKKVPHYGDVEKYPSKAEKRERKAAAQAGLSIQEYRAKLASQKPPTDDQAAVAAKLAKLSEKERAQCEERAALKNQSLEEYILRRIQKKNEKRAEHEGKKAVKVTNDAEAESSSALLYFVDTRGDQALTLPPSSNPAAAWPSLPRNSDGSLPLDPSIWEGRPVKTLTKDERRARLLYLRERRAKRKGIIPGTTPPVTRAQKKVEMKNKLTYQILCEKGITQGATKEQKTEVRKLARRILRQEKQARKAEKGGRKIKSRTGRN
ncbi:uncharacterized protein BDR25DRAFT_300908 [Lindgomyces ingoldianus]|uniref:Uncharacterized protein n=1 Tax=Lindgomyces ingoldianus TaxID=673940 RepID=A0ACB6RAE2_9PLEO|nr:uncharacterized protein BDR25DRAFT_300908 [Lindgomyces ingoldianus]KAF2476111.1 hypothetical protein BDR25DRAFT_300908 [Lindgomyces ingoldianus]